MWQDAAAKRFGGGRSFGIQRPMSSYNNYSNTAAKQSSGILGKSNTNRWGGMLGGLFGGLLIGGLLSSLFMGKGLSTGILTWIIVGAVILFIVSLFRRKMPSFQGNGQNQYNQYRENPFQQSNDPRGSSFNQGSQSNQGNQGQSSGFGFGSMAQNFMNQANDESDEDFLREAKVKFIRLQAAYDQKNMEDIREFTSPEVLAEIQMQFHEQEGAINQTEVVSLEAQLINKEQEGNTTIVSVRFTGLVKENSEKPEPLNEIWHFEKAGEYGKWIVCGVQQIKPL
jgi:predicted lipid-binding transport protein (Tim44 family)